MDYFIGFVLLLGILVFIHELGHFLAAKWCNIRCDTFSIGMGPKLLKFTKGETEYAVSILPLGGYVKLFGQDPREEIPAGQEHRSFRHKSLWQRAFVVVAGPLANLLLAMVVFAALMMHGFPSEAPAFNRVVPGSPAETAGFRSGDQIKSIAWNDAGVAHEVIPADLDQLKTTLAQNVGKDLKFSVQRRENTTAEILYAPVVIEQRDPTTGLIQNMGGIRGVEDQAPAPVLSTIVPGSWADTRMIPTPFLVSSVGVTKVNGQVQEIPVTTAFDLEHAWAQAVTLSPRAGSQIMLKGKWLIEDQEPKDETLSMAWSKAEDAPKESLLESGIYTYNALRLVEVLSASPAEEIGLKKGDVIVSINGEAIQGFYSFRDRLQELAAEKTTLEVQWIREGALMNKSFRPRLQNHEDPLTGQSKDRFQIGASFVPFDAAPAMTTVQSSSLFTAAAYGITKSFSVSGAMLKSFSYLIQGKLSRKALSGPFMIGKIAGDSFKAGWLPFLRMMAFISLNLFLLNLFPIPVLDGGHLVMFGIEAIRRKPLSIKFIERWSMAGFIFLLSLMAYVSVNDLIRMFF
ncbi:MAG TPA: RIP metalloprotease RseP [Bdellovibrionota bacterium]|jgi:regulator of sigma E protease|nr:RIP metalloprotease RseP [Bdellovibrionota bacterium]